MSTEITDPETTQAVVPIEPDPETAAPLTLSDALMHAMAAAEEALSALPAAPDAVTLTERHGVYEINLHFSQRRSEVLAFATAYDVEVTSAPNDFTKGQTFTEAVTAVRGIPVKAWTLTEEESDPEATTEIDMRETQDAQVSA